MAKPEIGKLDCPCCGEPASVREQKNGRAYLLCNSPVCGFQGFTRSPDADKHLRARMKVDPTVEPEKAPKPQPAPAPAPAPQPPKKKGFFDDLASL
jgi:hypothetical protein